MADKSAKLAYGSYAQIGDKIRDGSIDEHDIVFTSDTSEIVYVKGDLTPQVMKSRIELFDNIDSAVNTLNHRASSYPGQPVGIRGEDGNYDLYTTWLHGNTLSVKRLVYAPEIEAFENSTSEHINNNTVHITEAERTNWNDKVESSALEPFNEHIDNSEIHITQAERANYNEHINNEEIHTTQDEREAYIGHIENPNIHVTSSDKERWNSQGITFNSKADFVAEMKRHDIGSATHVFFPANVINEITGGKITSAVYGLMCHTATSRYDMNLYADGYMMYLVRLDDTGYVSRVSRATLATV